MHLKCPLGHLSKPIREQGLQSGIDSTTIKSVLYGYIPKSGEVFPHIETIFFENAAAMCIKPVSCVKTTFDCLTIEADWLRLNFPVPLKIFF